METNYQTLLEIHTQLFQQQHLHLHPPISHLVHLVILRVQAWIRLVQVQSQQTTLCQVIQVVMVVIPDIMDIMKTTRLKILITRQAVTVKATTLIKKMEHTLYIALITIWDLANQYHLTHHQVKSVLIALLTNTGQIMVSINTLVQGKVTISCFSSHPIKQLV